MQETLINGGKLIDGRKLIDGETLIAITHHWQETN